jgi:hypothetical protein
VGEVRKRGSGGMGKKPFGPCPIRRSCPDHRVKGGQLLPGGIFPDHRDTARQAFQRNRSPQGSPQCHGMGSATQQDFRRGLDGARHGRSGGHAKFAEHVRPHHACTHPATGMEAGQTGGPLRQKIGQHVQRHTVIDAIEDVSEYEIHFDYLRDALRDLLKPIALKGRVRRLADHLHQLGVAAIGLAEVPIYLARATAVDKVLEASVRLVRSESNRIRGIVFVPQDVRFPYLGCHVVLSLRDHIDVETGMIDADAVRSSYEAAIDPAVRGSAVHFRNQGDAAAQITVPGQDPWIVTGAKKVKLFERLFMAHRDREGAVKLEVLKKYAGFSQLPQLFGDEWTEVNGRYSSALIRVPMRNGTSVLKAIRHPVGAAETVRAAICDDELVQALGRGRGVNRNSEMPLEVHILGDVVLPILHDSVAPWESVCPDVFQRMLLAGVAVDSPADAVVLHPELFGTSEQARKAFDRAAFSGQNPIGNSYREMSVKSAAYRRTGRGRSWQRVWWISGTASDVRRQLETAVGKLAEWAPL